MATNNIFNVILEEPKWEQSLDNIMELSQKVVENTLSYVKVNDVIDFLEINKPLEINISLSNDSSVMRLNSEFRNIDKPTNVLSFANIDDDEFEFMIANEDVLELGDIILALETVEREAKEKNISLQDHYCHLLTHGVLHLLGFDHVDDEEAEEMEDFETSILSNINIKDPYKE